MGIELLLTRCLCENRFYTLVLDKEYCFHMVLLLGGRMNH